MDILVIGTTLEQSQFQAKRILGVMPHVKAYASEDPVELAQLHHFSLIVFAADTEGEQNDLIPILCEMLPKVLTPILLCWPFRPPFLAQGVYYVTPQNIHLAINEHAEIEMTTIE